MKKIVVALIASLLVIVVGTASLYVLSRQSLPPSGQLNPQPPGNILPGGPPGQPQQGGQAQGGPLAPAQGGGPPLAGQQIRAQAGAEKPPLLILTDELRNIVLQVAQEDQAVSALRSMLGITDSRLEDNGIQLPSGIVGTVHYIGPEWDMRVVVDVESKEVTTVHIERKRGPSQSQQFQDLEQIADFVRKAEQNPAVARRLEGKKYMTHVLPPTKEGIVGVGFIDRQTKKLLCIADVDSRSGQVRMREVASQQGRGAPFEGKAASQPIQPWQVVALLLLAALVGGLAYMVYSPRDKMIEQEKEKKPNR